MLNQYLQELEQDPFDGEEFVERLAWRVCSYSSMPGSSSGSFDPDILHESFLKAISDLKLLDERIAKKCNKLEAAVKDEEKQHYQQIALLLEHNKKGFQVFQDLDNHINSVATKVVHLGDQLENVNTPRSRAVEAQRLMNYFAEFFAEGPVVSQVFTDESQLNEAADVIQKLHLIAQELPSGKFETAKVKIANKYSQIEQSLISDFMKAQRTSDTERMREIAATLSHFKGYSQCETAFIEEVLIGAFKSREIFREIVPLCMKADSLVRSVFTNPEQVMAKFVITIFQEPLKDHIHAKLENKSAPDIYLKNLYSLYLETNRLVTELHGLNIGCDSQFLPRLAKQIFQQHLSSYLNVEICHLKEKFKIILSRYYESKGHQKKVIQTGGISEIREKIQDVITAKANITISIGPAAESYGGETFLSEEVAISILQETKLAFKRCQLLSSPSDVHTNAGEIFYVLTKALLVDHVNYAVDLGLQTIPGGEVRMPPEVTFFEIVQQSSSMVNLLDKLFNDIVVPLIMSTPKHGECLQHKKKSTQTLEEKLDIGLDRVLGALASYVRHLLSTEQKRTDFRPEDEDVLIANATPACRKVVHWVSQMADKIRSSLDGNNLDSVLLEFGLRLHRVILDHLMKYEYNSAGAMAVICDVNDYRKCVSALKQPLVNNLFDTLHTLCKLLQVSRDNLKMVCSGDQLSGLDRTVLISFIQLRSDFKQAKPVKISHYLEGI